MAGKSRSWGRIVASDKDASADVHIYDEIGFWGTTAASFAHEISGLEVDALKVFINSPGGDAFDGLAIMNALLRHPATVRVEVDGLAASAASVIAMAGDEIVMNRGSELMIHDASTWGGGNAEELRKAADALDKLSNSYADAYAARAGGTREDWRAVMLAETWYSAEEATDAGLATSWADAKPVKASALASFDLSKFRFQGRAAAPGPVFGVMKSSASSGSDATNKDGDVMTYDELRDAVADRLEVDAAELTDEELLTELDSALEGVADGEDAGDGDGVEAAPAAAAAAAAAAVPAVASAPAGMELVDAGALAQLRDRAAAGDQAAVAASVARREALVASAVADGRIAPASRSVWLTQLEKNEAGAGDLLASLAPNTIPVAEIGTASAEASSDDALLAKAGWGKKKEADRV